MPTKLRKRPATKKLSAPQQQATGEESRREVFLDFCDAVGLPPLMLEHVYGYSMPVVQAEASRILHGSAKESADAIVDKMCATLTAAGLYCEAADAVATSGRTMPLAERQTATTAGESKRKRPERGRPCDTDADADRRLVEAWKTGNYRTYLALAREKGITESDVKRAIDRHRKRTQKVPNQL